MHVCRWATARLYAEFSLFGTARAWAGDTEKTGEWEGGYRYDG